MPRKIMILEDDEATAELMKFYLEEEGFQTAISARGEDFVERVAKYQPDLISLDIELPGMDGFNIFQMLHKNEHTRDIPVIFVTVRESEKDKGIKMGAAAYIVKPFRGEELKDTINSILGKGVKV